MRLFKKRRKIKRRERLELEEDNDLSNTEFLLRIMYVVIDLFYTIFRLNHHIDFILFRVFRSNLDFGLKSRVNLN